MKWLAETNLPLSAVLSKLHTQALCGNGQIHMHLGENPPSEYSHIGATWPLYGRTDTAKDHH